MSSEMPSQDPHNRGGTTCRDADTHYSIYCSSTQRLQLIPIAWLRNFAQLPQTPPCCALRQALVFVFFVIFLFSFFAAIGQQGSFCSQLGRHLNWGHLHLSSALSPGPVSVDTFLIPFLDHAVTLDCPLPQTPIWTTLEALSTVLSSVNQQEIHLNSTRIGNTKRKGGVRH